MKWLYRALAIITLTAVCVSRTEALPQIDFNVIATTTGSISYAGGANPLKGSNISVDNVVGLNTPMNNNVLRNCISCTLTFMTGNLSGSTPLTNWEFASGGTITLTGGIDLNNNGNATDGVDVPV